MKIVKNICLGGFGVSEAVYKELGIKQNDYEDLSNEDFKIISNDPMKYRSDKRLITAIEKIGLKESAGRHAN